MTCVFSKGSSNWCQLLKLDNRVVLEGHSLKLWYASNLLPCFSPPQIEEGMLDATKYRVDDPVTDFSAYTLNMYCNKMPSFKNAVTLQFCNCSSWVWDWSQRLCLSLIDQTNLNWTRMEMRLSDSVLLKVSQQCIFRLIHKEMNTGAAYFFLTPIRDSTLRLSGMAERDSCCFLWDWEMTLVTNSLWVAALRAVWAILKRCKN